MKKAAIASIITLLFLSFATSSWGLTVGPSLAAPIGRNVQEAQKAIPADQAPVYDESADAKADIAAAVARAKKENRRVLVQPEHHRSDGLRRSRLRADRHRACLAA